MLTEALIPPDCNHPAQVAPGLYAFTCLSVAIPCAAGVQWNFVCRSLTPARFGSGSGL